MLSNTRYTTKATRENGIASVAKNVPDADTKEDLG
ncbi:YegP family protein [Flavobacterium sp. UBA6135]